MRRTGSYDSVSLMLVFDSCLVGVIALRCENLTHSLLEKLASLGVGVVFYMERKERLPCVLFD